MTPPDTGTTRMAVAELGAAPPYRRVPQVPALDGLRALAITAVVLFHYPTHSVVKGGLFGVGLFFVLSGFLVTPILASEHSRFGRIRLRRYLWRRAWRLVPALAAFLIVVILLTVFFGHAGWFASTPFGPTGAPGKPVSLPRTLTGALAALTYVYNFLPAYGVHMPQTLGHLWTLAIEGQFYLLWALLLACLLRLGPKVIIGVTMALIAVSGVAPFLAWTSTGTHDWTYYATTPNIQPLLAGALLAQLWYLGYLHRVPAWLIKLAALAGAAAMLYMFFEIGNVKFKYLGAFSAVSASGVVIVAHLVDDRGRSFIRSLLGVKPLIWLGQRSYAVYLWHWPLALWTNELPHLVGVPLGLTATLAAAELSWRLVERPASAFSRGRKEPAPPTIQDT